MDVSNILLLFESKNNNYDEKIQNELLTLKISLFPNPATGIMKIKFRKRDSK